MGRKEFINVWYGRKNYNKLLQAYPMHKKTKLHSFHSHCYFFKKKEI